MEAQQQERLNTVREAAARWHRHPQTVYDWIYAGAIKTVRLGRSRMVAESEILRVCREGVAQQRRRTVG